jgi:hypothetical protein
MIAQIVGLLLAGLLQKGGPGLFAIFALPMTLAFWGLPAFVMGSMMIMATFYGLKAAGRVGLTPIIMAICGAAWITSSASRPANP